MNVWLWRVQTASQSQLSSPVPPAVVWHKILTAPDLSTLEILDHRRRQGSLHWATRVETADTETPAQSAGLEGLVKSIQGYSVDLDGQMIMEEWQTTSRFYFSANLSTNLDVQNFRLRIVLRPWTIEIASDAAAKQVALTIKTGEVSWTRTYTEADLRDPGKILKEVAGPLPLWLPDFPWSGEAKLNGSLATNLQWSARHDTLNLPRSKLPVYRLTARLLDRFEAVFYVSRAGEILRVELPGGLLLVNSELSGP